MRFTILALALSSAACDGAEPEPETCAPSGAPNLADGAQVCEHTMGWAADQLLSRARDEWAPDARLGELGCPGVQAESGVVDECTGYVVASSRPSEEARCGADGCAAYDETVGGVGVDEWLVDSPDAIELLAGDDPGVGIILTSAMVVRVRWLFACGEEDPLPDEIPDDRGIYVGGSAGCFGDALVDGVTGEAYY